MASRRPWPRAADNDRMDAIAQLMDIETFAEYAYGCLEDGDAVEVARMLGIIKRKASSARTSLKQARDAENDKVTKTLGERRANNG